MRTKYRFIEGYRGNDTVRGWREYDSIYHAVFADMRGSTGYPKGDPYNTVPQGLLLRPAIPNDEIFGSDGTYGPKANFKISVRELPDDGRFRVTVTAAKYNDGLLLDPGAPSQTSTGIVWNDPKTPGSVTIPTRRHLPGGRLRAGTGVAAAGCLASTRRAGRLLARRYGRRRASGWERAVWSILRSARRCRSTAAAIRLWFRASALPTDDAMHVGEGDFTVAAWIHPSQRPQRRAWSVLDASDRLLGWYLEHPTTRAFCGFRPAGRTIAANATVSSPPGVIRANTWQHVAAVVRRGRNETRLYVNGYLVARASIGSAQFDDHEGGSPARAHSRARRHFRANWRMSAFTTGRSTRPKFRLWCSPESSLCKRQSGTKQEVTLTLGGRQFSGTLQQPAFLVVRLEAGAAAAAAFRAPAPGSGSRGVHAALRPATNWRSVSWRLRSGRRRLGVHLGLRRDCGSTLAPVGAPQDRGRAKSSRALCLREPSAISPARRWRRTTSTISRACVKSASAASTRTAATCRACSSAPWNSKDRFTNRGRRRRTGTSSSISTARTICRRMRERSSTSFATRAYRRPVTAAEESALMAVYQKSSGRRTQLSRTASRTRCWWC